MLIKGSVFKLILGSLFVLGFAAAGVAYYAFVKPNTPYLKNWWIDTNLGSCEPSITWVDYAQNEVGFKIYRRNPGTGQKFTLLEIVRPSPGKGTPTTFTDSPLPLGTYTYQVSAFNDWGESISDQASVTVASSVCAKVKITDFTKLPMNPLIVSLSIINDCSVHITYRDNSTNEQGFKIVRNTMSPETPWVLIKTLGSHAGIPATYDDKTKLPGGTYGYRIIAYNQSGELASNYSKINVTSECNPAVKFIPSSGPLILPTMKKLSAIPCIWEAATNVYLRKGPDVAAFDQLGYEPAAQTFPIVGQSQDGQFWVVQVESGEVGYITKSTDYSLISGDCSIVPTLEDPVPPVGIPTPTPTVQPGSNNNNDATQCPIGAVCP